MFRQSEREMAAALRRTGHRELTQRSWTLLRCTGAENDHIRCSPKDDMGWVEGELEQMEGNDMIMREFMMSELI